MWDRYQLSLLSVGGVALAAAGGGGGRNLVVITLSCISNIASCGVRAHVLETRTRFGTTSTHGGVPRFRFRGLKSEVPGSGSADHEV